MKKTLKYVIIPVAVLFILCSFTACSNSEDPLESIQLVTTTDSALVEYTAAKTEETRSETEIPEQLYGEQEITAEDIKYYSHDYDIIKLKENGDFVLDNFISSFMSIELLKGEITTQYEYEDDMLILEYSNGVNLYFEINEEEDTLTFKKDLSYYPFELAQPLWGGEIGIKDGSVFERKYYD